MSNSAKETTSRITIDFQSPQTRTIITLGVVGAYVLVFIPLYGVTGTEVASLSIFPVMVAAWFFGLRVGLLAGLLSLPLNTLLLNLVGYEPGGLGVVIQSGGGLGTITIVLSGMIVGRLHDLSRQLKQELVKREQIETSLRQSTQNQHHLIAAERKQRLLAETLNKVGLALNSTLELAEVLNLICQESMNLFQVETTFIWLVQGEELFGYAGYGQGQESFLGMQIPISDTNTLGAMVVREMRPIFVNEATKSELVNPKLIKLFQVEAILGVPFFFKGDKALGALMIIDTHEAQRFSQDDVKIAEALGNYAAIAIQNAQLFDAEAHRRHEAEMLYQSTVTLTSALDLHSVLDNILAQLEQAVPYDSACVFLRLEDKLQVVGAKGFADLNQVVGRVYPIDDALFDEIRRTQQPLILPDAQANPRFQEWGHSSHIRGWMGIPLIVQERAIGCLTLDSRRVDAYSQVDAILVQTFANQAAVAIANAQLFEQTQVALAQSDALYQAARTLITLTDLPEMLQSFVDRVAETLPANRVSLITVDRQARQIIRVVIGGPRADKFSRFYYDDIWEGLIGWTLRELKPALVLRGQRDPRQSAAIHQRRAKTKAGATITVPLRYRDDVFGVMAAVNSIDEPDFTPQDVELMMAIANQAAIAIENARLFETTQEAHRLSDTLREIEASLTATLDLEEVLDRIFDGLGKVVPYASVSLMLIEDNVLRIKAARGLPDDSPVWSYAFVIGEEGIVHEIYKTKKPIIISDVYQDPDFVRMEGSEHIRGWLGVPLIARDQVTGILNIDHDQPGFYTERHATIATSFAHKAAIAIENARLFDETFRRAQQLTLLNELAGEMTGTLDTQELCTMVTERLYPLFNYYNVAIFIADLEAEELVLQTNLGASVNIARPGEYRRAIGKGIIGRAAKTLKMIVVNDTQQHPDFLNLEEMNVRSQIAIPLKVGQHLIGVMNIDSDQTNVFDENDVAALKTIADHLAVALEKARLFTETQQRAEHLETLRRASLSLTSSLELQSVLETILQSALNLLAGADNAHIFLYQDDHLTYKTALWKDGRREKTFSEPRPQGLTYTIARRGEAIVVPNMRTHPLFANATFKLQGAIIGLPLKISRRVVGVMNVAFAHPQTWLEAELYALELLADQAAIAIQNAKLYEKVQQHSAQLEARVAERTFKLQALYELAHKLGHTTQLSEVIRLTLLELYQTLPHDVAASLLLTDTKNILVIQSQHALTPYVETQIQEILLETIPSLGNQMIDEKTLEVHRLQPSIEDDLRPPLKNLGSVMTVPMLTYKTGRGLLLVATEQESQFNIEQKRLLYIVANQAADTIRRLQSLLAAEHQRLENLVAHLSNGLIMLNSEQQIVLANPLAQKLISNLTTAQVGDRLTQLGEYSVEMILDSISNDTPWTLVTQDWPSQLIEIVANPITTGLEAGGWTLVLRDVTEERSIQKRIQQQERMAAVGQLAAGVAHDFNNILTSIIGYAELLLLEPSLSSAAKDDVERITKQGQRAAHLVRQILDFSRQTISAKHPLDLLPFVQETIKLLERTIREDIHISLEAEPGDYEILGDLTQIQQALTNLAINARDAMLAGGNLRFQLSRLVLYPGEESPDSELSPGDWIVLAISDTGIGIPAELHQQIFEPFFTTKEVGEGTGLGLAQVYGIMRQHDGHIGVKSQMEIGTTFSLYFPALLSPASSSQEVISELPRGDNELILLVEDDLSVLRITANMLQHLGYRTLTATNGYEALKVYDERQSEIALVLTDLTMPQMGGTELTSALRKRNPAIKVVVLTGYPLEAIGKTALTQGIVDWLQKPLSVENLAHTISRSLDLKKEAS